MLSSKTSIKRKSFFTQTPNEILRGCRAKPLAKLLWIYLNSHQDGYHPKFKQIVADLGVSDKTISKSLRQLEKLNMITVAQVKNMYHYDLIPPEEWYQEECVSDRRKKKPSYMYDDLVVDVRHPSSTYNNNENYDDEKAPQELNEQKNEQIEARNKNAFSDIKKANIKIKPNEFNYCLSMVRRLGFSDAKIDSLMGEACLYLMERSSTRPASALLNWFKFYKEPKKRVKKTEEKPLSKTEQVKKAARDFFFVPEEPKVDANGFFQVPEDHKGRED